MTAERLTLCPAVAAAFQQAVSVQSAFLRNRLVGVAVAKAVDEAETGDTVLLAPAAASFDRYDSFEKRGEDFVAQVKAVLSSQT